MNGCVCCSNLDAISNTSLPDLFINASDVKSITLNGYEKWYRSHGQHLKIPDYNITACSLEDELKQVLNAYIVWNYIF